MSDVIELTDTWGAKITICSNTETMCDCLDGILIEGFEEDITREAVYEAQKVLNDMCKSSPADEDSSFFNWRGGKHHQATYKYGGVLAAELYHRELEAIRYDAITSGVGYSEWDWMSEEDTPYILRIGIRAILERMFKAIEKSRDKLQHYLAIKMEQIAEEDSK